MKEAVCKILAGNGDRVKKSIQDFDTIDLVGSGECDVYAITKGKQKTFLKIKRANSCTNFKVEAFVLKSLRALNAKVPDVIKQSANFIITSENQGECLNDRPHLFLKKSIYEGLSEDLRKFYKIKFNGFGAIENTHGVHQEWIYFFDGVKPWAKTIKNRSLADVKSVEILEKYWRKNSLLLGGVKNSYLVHGDFCTDHIFAYKGSYSGIIDFGDAFAGDPLIDLAYFKFKETTKPYGLKTFRFLKNAYGKFLTIGSNETKLINLYMIYWALRRVVESNDFDTAKTFAQKLERLAKDLAADV